MSTAALQPGSDGHSLTWRVLHTPIAELLRGRIGSGAAADRVIAAANLPASLAERVRLVVGQTRLWRGEKATVAPDSKLAPVRLRVRSLCGAAVGGMTEAN